MDPDIPFAIVCSLDSDDPRFPNGPDILACATQKCSSAQIQKYEIQSLTGPLPDISSLNHRSTAGCLAKGHLGHNGILLDDSTTFDTKAVSGCDIVFYDGSTAITTHRLETES